MWPLHIFIPVTSSFFMCELVIGTVQNIMQYKLLYIIYTFVSAWFDKESRIVFNKILTYYLHYQGKYHFLLGCLVYTNYG